MAFNDWLPDLKGALVGFYDERLKVQIETKTAEYEKLAKEHLAHGKRTQQILITMALIALLLLTYHCFGKENKKLPKNN